MGQSLWMTFNAIQENIVRGCLHGSNRNAECRNRRGQTGRSPEPPSGVLLGSRATKGDFENDPRKNKAAVSSLIGSR